MLLFMDGLIHGSNQAMYGNAVRLYGGNIMIHAPGYREKASQSPLLPLADPGRVMETVKRQDHVLAVSKRINTFGLVSSGGVNYPIAITAIEPEAERSTSIIAEYTREGRFLQGTDQEGILIGRGLAELLNVGVGNRLNILGRRQGETMRQHAMTVVGIYDMNLQEAERRTIYMNLPMAQTLYNLRNQVTEVTVNLDNVNNEDHVLKSLRAALPEDEVDTWVTIKPEIQQVMNIKSAFTSIFGLVVLLIACIGVLNLMLMAAFERTREMGVLSALGMKRGQVMLLYLLEGTIIGTLGALGGCLLGVVLVALTAIQGIDISYASGVGEMTALLGAKIVPVITTANIISRGISVAFIAALSSFLPAWQASKKEPVESLHFV